LATATLAAGSVAVVRRLDPAARGAGAVTGALVVAWATVVASATLLGLVRLLTPFALLVAVTLASLAGLSWGRRAAAGTRVEPTRPEEARPGVVFPALWLSLGAVGFARVLTTGVFVFPTDYDTLMYHLPLIGHWLQEGSLYVPRSAHWSFPGNGELLGLWAVGPFSGDFLIGLTNIVPTVLLAASATALGGTLGLSRASRNLAAVAIVANLVVLNELVDAKNDVSVAALLLASVLYGLRWSREGSTGSLVLGATSLGLLTGVKFFALGYAAVAWATLAGLVVLTRGPRAGVRFATAWAAGAVVFGGYWYLRNAVVTGSPFYPLELAHGGGASGRVYPGVWTSTFLGCGKPEAFPLGLAAAWAMTGVVNFAALTALPLTLFTIGALGARAVRRGDRTGGLITASLVPLVIGSFLVLLATPFCVEDMPGTLNQLKSSFTPARYGISVLALSLLAAAVALESLGHRFAAVVLAAATFAQCVGLVVGRTAFFDFMSQQSPSSAIVPTSLPPVLVAVVAVAAGLAVAWRVGSNRPSWRRPLAAALALVVLSATATGVAALSRGWHGRFTHHYNRQFYTKVFGRIATTIPDGATFLVFDYRPYPFFGSRRQYRVDNPAGPVSYAAALDRVASRGPALVAVRKEIDPPWAHYRDTEQFFFDRPAGFRPFDLGVFLSVFEVVKNPAASGLAQAAEAGLEPADDHDVQRTGQR